MPDARDDGSRSFYFFDIDDNLLFLPTMNYLWNAETEKEMPVNSGELAAYLPHLGRPGPWEAWSVRYETYRDSRDALDTPPREQTFIKDLLAAIGKNGQWRGPSWRLLQHAALNKRPIAAITARGHHPSTIEEGFKLLAERRLIAAVPTILKLYPITTARRYAQRSALAIRR